MSQEAERRFPTPRPIAVDFFCGAGGMSLGIEQAGFDVALGVDVDGHHVATHEHNFPYGKTICASVVDLTGERIRERIGTDREIDLVVGGPPCQGFSNMGLRDLRDPRNSLIDHYLRLVLEIRPKAFVMENVPGMLAGATRSILDQLVAVAREEGYNVTLPVQLLDAAHFGVPQQRRRLFVLGVRSDVAERLEYPAGPAPGQPARPTVWQAIADLPNVQADDLLFKRNQTKYTKTPKSEYSQVARGARLDPSDLSKPRAWDSDICTGCLRTLHAAKSVEIYAATPPGETAPGHKLPRLHPEGICPTLRAGSDSTHGSYTAPRPIHPKDPRCVTAREAARLHGFPDWFEFFPSKWHAYRQIGNAVCPPVARAIGMSVRAALGGRTSVRPPAPVSMGDGFVLPMNRPKTLRRIPQLRQFTPVVTYLFERAFDSDRKLLKRPAFDFRDVQTAISATRVNLSWVRADTFLAEIARSRRVRDMLAVPLLQGYSILPSKSGDAIGEFVPVGTAGTLEDKVDLRVRVDDLHEAIVIHSPPVKFNGSGWQAVAFLSEPSVQKQLWKKKCVVGLLDESNGKGRGTADAQVVTVRRPPKFAVDRLGVIACKAAALPNRARLRRLANDLETDTIVVLVQATRNHVVSVRMDDCLKSPREAARGAFEFDGK